ncbi:hypothetical protein Hte_001671 [Hypoxylon texense]
MSLLSRALLGLSLATSVLGVPMRPSPGGAPDLCHEGTRKCNLETVYLCRDSKWIEHESCDEPTWCKADLGGNAWCASGLELKKRAIAIPSPTITKPPSAKATGPPGWCTAGQTRCNGKNLQICNDNGKWEGFQTCSECITEGKQNNCIPFTDTSAAPNATPSVAQPTPSPSFSPTWDEPCFAGEVRCVGKDRIEACSAERNWEDFGPCPDCKQRYNTAVSCSFDDADLSNFWTVGTVPTPTREVDVGPAEECAQGFQRCARNNTTIETCNEGHWAVEGCAEGQTCVGIHEGIAWCSVQ